MSRRVAGWVSPSPTSPGLRAFLNSLVLGTSIPTLCWGRRSWRSKVTIQGHIA